MDFKVILGNKIKDVREQFNLNQQDFVDRLNIDITRASLSRIEAGKQMPSAEIIKNIIETYNVSPYWILDINEILDDNDITIKYNKLNNKDKETIDNYINFLLYNKK